MIRFSNVTIAYERADSRLYIAKDFNITFENDRFTCILGPSGCGKTTILNVIAGFHKALDGSVSIGEKSADLRIGYVFQGHNIFPWKTVYQNIAFGLSGYSIDKVMQDEKIKGIAEDMGLSDVLNSYSESLSGGMKQRVGIARALVGNPDVILMDEPFGSLDALTANKARTLLTKICSERRTTVIFVTHNIDEALELGDRIVVVSRSPMEILIDRKLDIKEPIHSSNKLELKSDIYKALESNIREE